MRIFGKRLFETPTDNPISLEEVQSHIDSSLVAKIVLEFNREFKDVYPTDVRSRYIAVGPAQALLGLAIKNGHIKVNTDS